MYYADLDEWLAMGAPPSRLLAVGWLQPGRPFDQGDVDAGFFEALTALLRDPWQPASALGIHRCTFCRFSGGPGLLEFRGNRVELGRQNLFVPAAEVTFVAPSMIAHYVDCHGYAPPAEFRRAVLSCPPMRSIDYLKLIRAAKLNQLGRQQPKEGGP